MSTKIYAIRAHQNILMIIKNWEPLNYTPINTLWYIYTLGYYAALKK